MIEILLCRTSIASKYGVDVAVLVNGIYCWLAKNASDGNHYHDGRYWAYASYSSIVKWFSPLWSLDQVKRLVSKCRESGILLIGNYNDDKVDRTNWYSLSDEIFDIYGENFDDNEVVRNRTLHSAKSPDALGEIARCNIMNNNNIIPPKAPQGGRRVREPKEKADWKPDRFERLWQFYPHDKRGNKQKAISAWDKLKPDDALIAKMGRDLSLLLDTIWADVGTPHVSTFLNGRRWEDAENVETRSQVGTVERTDSGVTGWI